MALVTGSRYKDPLSRRGGLAASFLPPDVWRYARSRAQSPCLRENDDANREEGRSLSPDQSVACGSDGDPSSFLWEVPYSTLLSPSCNVPRARKKKKRPIMAKFD